MSQKRLIIRNVIYNWAGTGLGIVVGFLVAPFLVRQLGEAVYGLWIVIGSLTNYFGLLDLGIRGSVGRHIAYERAKNDQQSMCEYLSTALFLLSGFGLIGLMAIVAIVPVFPRFFDIPEGQVASGQLALLIVGINLGLVLPLSAFDAALWGFQRFDLLNAVDIPGTIIRAALTFVLIGQGYGLVALALLTLVINAVCGVMKIAFTFFDFPGLRISTRYITWNASKGLMVYGTWNFAINVANLTRSHVWPLIIGSWLGLLQVTVYSVARRLVDCAEKALWDGTGVLTPAAAGFDAQQDWSRQQALAIEMGKWCMNLALFLVTFFILLGQPVISLWMGQHLAFASMYLSILAVGEGVAMSQQVTASILIGLAKHKVIAWLCLGEIVLSLILAAALAWPLGLFGLCIAASISAGLCRGILLLIYGCHVAGVSLRKYAQQAVLPPVLAGILPVVGLATVVAWKSPETLGGLLVYLVLYMAVYSLFTGLVLMRGRLRCFLPAHIGATRRQVIPTSEAPTGTTSV
jgi:O-antigen/teichoic acid export membrane protein